MQSLAYIESSKILEEAYLVAEGRIPFDRIDVKVLVVGADRKKFRAKARAYLESWDAKSFGPHQKMLVRYLPFYKRRVFFDIMHYKKKRAQVLQEYYQKKS